MNNWALNYLGKPWIVGANGPDSFDCWGLLEHIYAEKKGIILPRYEHVNKLDKTQVVDEISKEIYQKWEQLLFPVDLCAVTLSNLPDKVFHVGCFISSDKGYVLHTRQKFGCMIEPLDKIILNWKYIHFYGLR